MLTPAALTSAIASYRSDATGLVCAYRFLPGAPGEALTSDAVLQWIDDHANEDRGDFAWLHFDLTHVAAEKWMREHLTMPDVFLESLQQGPRGTRIELAEDTLVAVLNDVIYDFAFDATHTSTLWVAADRRLLITARRKSLRSIDRLRTGVRKGDPFRSTVELLVHLLRDQGDVLVAILRDATARVDSIEDSLLAGRLDTKRADLGGLRRVLVRLQRLLAPEPAALFRLLNQRPAWIQDGDLQGLRESTEEFAAALNDGAGLLERIKLLQEEVAGKISEQSNRLLLLLSVVTVAGLPFTVIGGLFGMNVGGIPLADDPRGFWIIVGLVSVLTVGGLWFIFRSLRK